MALRVGYEGLSPEGPAEPRLLDASRRIVDLRLASLDGVRTVALSPFLMQ